MFGLNRGEFDSFEEAINKVKDNRSKYIYDYEDIIDEWGITNIVHDCKIINIFTDNNISLLVSERNKDNGKIYYQLSSSLSDVQKEQIKIISAVYEPIKLFAYTHGDKNLIENWIEGSVLGRVSDNSQIIKYDFNLGIEGFCTKKDSSEFMPGAFEKAVLEAYKNEKKNIYLVVTNITESLFFNTISRYTSLLKRIDEVKNLFHGWSAEPLYDEKFYKWLTTKSNRARNILPKDKILLPSNLQIVGTIIMNEENSNTQFDYKFRRCLVDTEKSAVTDDSNMDESLRVTTGENILLYGVPGSGKSWTIQHEYCDDEECMERLVFHPDYMYSDFVGQILPVVKRDDEGKEKVRYEFKPGPFTKILKKAYEDPEKSYYLVIEEINRGNAPAIFGEIFQLLDRMDEDKDGYKKGTSEYGITNENIALEVYGDVDTKVRIPSNLSILGTMNTSDQNVFTLDTAFQRRWIMRMIKNTFSNHKYANKKILDTNVSWKQFCEAINDEILRRNNVTSSEDKRLGAYFVSADDLLHIKTQDNSSEKQKIEAEHKNARFAEKVIKYLWDDAFKFSHPDTFDTRKYKSLEKIIDVFNSSSEDARFDVFHENLRKLILEGVEENNSVSDEDNE